jgi:hypothetical protein
MSPPPSKWVPADTPGVAYEIDPQPGIMNGTWWHVIHNGVVAFEGVVSGVSAQVRVDTLALAKSMAAAFAQLHGEPPPTEPIVDPPPAPVVLIACGKGKRPRACAALELYTGPHYQLRRKWCREVKGVEPAGILSAMHGLLRPDVIVGPYDLTMDALSKAERASWASDVLREVLRRWPENTEIIVLAGAQYVTGWAGEARRQSRPVVHRTFPGIGHERKALADEIAEALRPPGEPSQEDLFQGATDH